MKRIITAFAAAALLAGAASPAFAQQHWREGHEWVRDNHAAHVEAHRDHFVYRGRVWHAGDRWYGHPVRYYNGAWGYWAPRNGTNVFFRISI
jgi:hypothetical protein